MGVSSFSPAFNKKRKGQSYRLTFPFLRVPGLEPGAFWFVAKRSIQLGYIRLIVGPNIA